MESGRKNIMNFDNQSDKKESKIWIDKDGIINIKIVLQDPLKDIGELLKKTNEILNSSREKRILVDLNGPILGHIRSSYSRQQLTGHLKEWIKGVLFKKGAIFSSSVIRRTITSFIVMASGLKNIKIFENKKEALRWLKQN